MKLTARRVRRLRQIALDIRHLRKPLVELPREIEISGELPRGKETQ